jgi:hypothetical protein
MHGHFALILIGSMVIGAGALLALIARSARNQSIELREIPRVLSALLAAKSSPAFAVFIFDVPDRARGDGTLNLQFSIENGKVGFDWVLLGPQNRRDEERYVAFARSSGYEPVLEEGNGVRYWRVEQGDVARLGGDVITKMYHRSSEKSVKLLVEGFEWKP